MTAFLGFYSIYLFNDLNFFLIPSPFSPPFSLAVCAQQDFVQSDLELLFGIWRRLECDVWPLLILERQQGAVRPFNRGAQGVFSPSSVISALGFAQRLPSPLTHHCAIAPP